jgi:hypothetical protein
MYNEEVLFETSKLAKEKGFDEQCDDCYDGNGHSYSNGWCERVDDHFEDTFSNSELESVSLHYYTKPTQSLLERWLREKHNTHIWTVMSGGERFSLHFRHIDKDGKHWLHVHREDKIIVLFESHEKAIEEGLKEALKLIKNS